MILDEAQIKALAISKTDKWIEKARKDSHKLKMHFFGENKDQYLTKIEGLENATQLKLRKDHSPSNQHVVENLLRPFDNVWSAKGGLIKLTMKTPELQTRYDEQIKNVKNGMDTHQYLKDIWSNSLFTDPSGLLFMELSTDGEQAYLTQKSIHDIKNMKLSGIVPEYVVFEVDEVITEDVEISTPELDEKRKAKAEKMRKMWIIDDAFYYRVQVKGNEVTIIESRTVANSFGKVPGIVNSSVVDTSREVKTPVSPIWKQVELLDNYLVNNSVKEIHQFLHGYPIFWMYARRCETCNGKKEVWVPPTGDQTEGKWQTCTTCNGTGRSKKKDVSDGIILNPPKDAQSPTIDEPAGYVEPGISTWQEQRVELDWKWNQLFFSHWGTTVERKNNETATGRFIDAQPVNNRLNDYSDLVEVVHKWVLSMFAKFVAENSVDSVVVNYGRRYLIETPDQIWEKYINAKKDNAPETALNLLLIQFYESEFQHNEVMREYYLKLMVLEPYVHKTVEATLELPISELEKSMKLYFQEWVGQTMIADIIKEDVDVLRKNLEEFATSKMVEPQPIE